MVRYDFTGAFYSIVNYLIYCPRRINYTCSIIFICFFPALLSAQENVTLSPPNLKFLNDRLIIKYDITGYEISDRFSVWIESPIQPVIKLPPVPSTGTLEMKSPGDFKSK